MPMPTTDSLDVILENNHGLHARPATRVVQKAKEFQSELSMSANGRRADCKSILDILSCGCPSGAKITVNATGPDSKEAVIALTNLIKEL